MTSCGQGTGNVHAAWRMAVARRAAAGYAANPGPAALAVAGSVGACVADRSRVRKLSRPDSRKVTNCGTRYAAGRLLNGPD